MAKIAILAMASICAGVLSSVLAQTPAARDHDRRRTASEESNLDSQAASHSTPTPTIRVATVEFESDAPLPEPAEERLRRYITRRAIYDTADWVEELEQRVVDAWEQYGYFKATTRTSVRQLGQNPAERKFALIFHITAGRQYRLGEIRFFGAKLVNPDILRRCFPLREGDIFDTHRLGSGLESLRKTYGRQGYIEFIAVPLFQFEEGTGRISVILEVDEGKQYHLGQVSILGLNKDVADKLFQDSGLRSGVVLSTELVEDFMRKNRSVFPSGAAEDIERKINNESNTVDLIFHVPSDEP